MAHLHQLAFYVVKSDAGASMLEIPECSESETL